MAKHTATPESILSTLSPEAASVLESHFRSQLASELTASLSGTAPAPKAKATKAAKPAKRTVNRQHTNDGTNRSASQFIRDCDVANPGISAKDVCVKGAEVGLNIEAPLVYNVRQLVRKAAAAAGNADEKAAEQAAAEKKAAETKAKRAENLKKAREAKAAKRAAAEAEANAKTAEAAKKS